MICSKIQKGSELIKEAQLLKEALEKNEERDSDVLKYVFEQLRDKEVLSSDVVERFEAHRKKLEECPIPLNPYNDCNAEEIYDFIKQWKKEFDVIFEELKK